MPDACRIGHLMPIAVGMIIGAADSSDGILMTYTQIFASFLANATLPLAA
ncbi:hypothetical protein GWA01_08310 [Gluconobacter wancherniae NBRC 103581]|uniref:Uncharacterized protein n=1 Tax=Gluconobacter wancherniae NBRC 103581 TaxID=656744 RepID=A0A511B0S8_9PROT|nr:hypothetical protein AA103581_0626 [Gluconobacter wancherniae NBRC 103581]GEK93061.1 hypothetical protein GWA01_08310 [Gluconobacter wancherniae NBRC 103581]